MSSAATTSAPASSSASRGGASPTCPIGVAARTRVPAPSVVTVPMMSHQLHVDFPPVTTVDRPPRAGLSRTASGDDVPLAAERARPWIDLDGRLFGWLAPIGVTLLALGLRLWHLGNPKVFEFDETYYAKDAWSMLHNGYVRDYVDKVGGAKVNDAILDGTTTGLWEDKPSMVVHPDVGKWLIALGEKAFGMDPFGWRIASAIVGALMVLVLCRLVRRLTGSTMLGCVAGLLLTLDGLHFVLSRLALLDIFLAFFVLCGVTCLVNDRFWFREKLARLLDDRGDEQVRRERDWGPVRGLLFRPWLLLGRHLLRPRGRHQVDRDLPDGGVRRAGLAVERRSPAVLRRPVVAGAVGVRRRHPGLRPAGPGRVRGLRRQLDRLAGARQRVRGAPLLHAVHAVRVREPLQGRRDRQHAQRRPLADRDREGRQRAGRARPVAAVALVLPPGRLRLPRPLPQLQRAHLRLEAVRLAGHQPAGGRRGGHQHPARHAWLRRARGQ